MKSKKCFQYNSELFLKVGGEPTKCPNCGALNEGIDQHESDIFQKKKNSKSKVANDSVIGVVIGSSLGD